MRVLKIVGSNSWLFHHRMTLPISAVNDAIYLDLVYRDGTSLHGQIAPFACGTHDWQFSSVTIKPAKPIKSLTYNVLFRYKSGKFMDPSNPTQPSEGRKFHFRGWTGPITSTEPRIEVDVSQNLRLIAAFELQK